MPRINKTILGVLLITLLGFILRIWKIDQYPPSLLWDEVSIGYNAFSLLKTGRDEWNNTFPLFFTAFGEYKLPLYIYLTLINMLFVGFNPLAVRLASVLSGTLLIPLTYLIALKMTDNKITALFSSFLVAFSPWTIMFSRIGIEGNLACTLFAFGILFLLKWQETNELKFPLLTAFFFGFALHSYNASRVMIPILTCVIFFKVIKRCKIKSFVVYSLFLGLFILPVLNQIASGAGLIRFQQESTSMFLSESAILQGNAYLHWPSLFVKLIFSQPLVFFYTFLRNIGNVFNPFYLFVNGNGCLPEYCFPGHGFLLTIVAPFMAVGILVSIIGRDLKLKYLLYWFLAGFIPAAMTFNPYQPIRSILTLPTPMILSAIGFVWLFDRFKSLFSKNNKYYLFPLIILIIYLVNFVNWWNLYWNEYVKQNSSRMQYGYRELVVKLKELYPYYDKIFITWNYGEPHEFILYWWPWDPARYHQDKNFKFSYRDESQTWRTVNSFDKFEFIKSQDSFIDNEQEILKQTVLIQKKISNQKILIILSNKSENRNLKLLDRIDFINGNPAFYIYKFENNIN